MFVAGDDVVGIALAGTFENHVVIGVFAMADSALWIDESAKKCEIPEKCLNISAFDVGGDLWSPHDFAKFVEDRLGDDRDDASSANGEDNRLHGRTSPHVTDH